MDETPASKRGIFGDGVRRLLDERGEERLSLGSQTAMLEHQGRRHVVRLVNLSPSGAMVAFHGELGDDEAVTLHLLDHGPVTGQVRWSRDGRIGVNFVRPLDSKLEQE